MELKGKGVFITGASAGIGEALAREFAQRGSNLVLVARRKDRLEALAAELKSKGVRVLTFIADVTQDGDLEKVAAAARKEFGKIDIVIANAGFGVAGDVQDLKLEDYRRQFETNIFGVLRTIQATLEDLKKSRGSYVLLGSVAGYIALPGGSPYAMSKHAVHALANSFRGELKKDGVTVTLIAPGFVVSEIRQIDNQGLHHPNASDPVPPFLRVPTEVAARKIVRAIVQRRPEAVITAHGKVAVFIQRHLPRWISLVTALGVKGRKQAEVK